MDWWSRLLLIEILLPDDELEIQNRNLDSLVTTLPKVSVAKKKRAEEGEFKVRSVR